jgi:hypothetical protein
MLPLSVSPYVIIEHMQVRTTVHNPLCQLVATTSTQHRARSVVTTVVKQAMQPGIFTCNNKNQNEPTKN